MRDLSNLLKRIYGVLDKKAAYKAAVIDVVRERIGVTLKPEDISIKETVLEITASPAVKNEIEMKKVLVLGDLRELHKLHLSRILYK